MGFSYIRINIHTCRFFSILGYYMIMSIVSHAIHRLVGYLSYI